VHHIDGNGRGVEKSKQNNDLKNLIVMCLSCHMRYHAIEKWKARRCETKNQLAAPPNIAQRCAMS
jgi:hypothetical protein